MMERQVRVIAAYTSSNSDPITFSTGEILSVEDRTTEWKGWTWCRDVSGRGGWVPDDYIIRLGDQAVGKQDYNAVELSISTGEILTAYKEESGWLWCSNQAGIFGWVPCENITEFS